MLLLDAHTYLWFVGESPLLPQWVSEKIQTSEKVFVSIATFWEIAIKNRKELPFIHKDPFDRIMICQAQAEGMALVTVD